MTDFSTITACGECCVGCPKKLDGRCPGCIEADGRVPEWAESGRCKVHTCTRNHHAQFCGLCAEFPCAKLPSLISWNPDIVEKMTALRNEYRRIDIPASVADILGNQTGKLDGLGKSKAQVLLFDDYVLKIRPADDRDTVDVQVLQWLAGKVPVPQIAAHEVQNGQDWLLMTRVQGKELCKPDVMSNPSLLLDCMADALHTLWAIPVADCPFERTVADNLAHAETAIQTGHFDPSDCEPETFGPGGFENPNALLYWLKENMPPQDRVVTHGDFCLPNLFTDGKQFTGFIDVGNVGSNDRWMDLALGWRSLKHNSDGHYGKVYPKIDPDDLFRAAGVPKDEEKLRYYILLDELN